MRPSPGPRSGIRRLLSQPDVILAPGAFDVMSARLIAQTGAPMVYFGGLANEASDLGLPDLGFTTVSEIVRRAANIARVVDVPIMCDADTGFGGTVNVIRTVRDFEAAGVSAIHIEDQSFPKRCGVLAGKTVVPPHDFAQTVKRACDARRTADFLIVARSDAKSSDGVDGVIDRLKRYADAGAEAVMLGDFYAAAEYERIVRAVPVPLIAIAADPDHFATQPDFSRAQWQSFGVRMVIYWHLPLFAAIKAVREAVRHLQRHGSTTAPPLPIDGYGAYAEAVDLAAWLKIADDTGTGGNSD